MNAAELFAGIGGIGIGLERAGIPIQWRCELDPYCQRILRRHYPDAPLVADVHDVPAAYQRGDIGWVDMLAGGFPCQPVSQAGKRLAQADARWLWPAFAECIRVLRPRYVVVENVPGLLARGMGDVLGDLAALGFDAEWTVFGARDVGAPHRRDRVWILAWRADADSNGLEGVAELQGGRNAVRPRAARWDDADGLRLALADASVEPAWEPWRGISRAGRWTHAGGRSGEREAWSVEPDVGRVAHGVPARVDRLRALGNAVVPACAEHIGRRLMQHVRAQARVAS